MDLKKFIKKTTLYTAAIVMGLCVFHMAPVTIEVKAATETAKNITENKESNYDRWMEICDNMLERLKKHHFRYSNSGTKSTYRKAKASRKRCNCALFVSWCLQEYGATDFGDTFYVKGGGRIKSNFKWDRKRVKIIKVYRRCSSAHLQPGDAVCWAGTPHANIYAGKSKSGKRLWYDGGKVATRGNHNGARYSKTGKRSLGYLNHRKISYIIRIRDLDD